MTFINLGDIRIEEPVTVLTDILVAAVAMWAFLNLGKTVKYHQLKKYLRAHFLFLSIGTLLGGLLGHGFLHYLSFAYKLPGWLLSLLSVSFLSIAVLKYSCNALSSSVYKLLFRFIVIESILATLLTTLNLSFFWVSMHSVVLLIGFSLPLLIRSHFSFTPTRALRFLSIGLALNAVSAVVFATELSFDIWFNHIDISHVIMAVSIPYFLLAGKFMMKSSPSIVNSK
ncbi:DUF6962 family protein [Salibacter sp.]|uniref:DUF6962 family protein n=1 Tax=Salibacter sp. TaxID=2010995 RepID=UPI00286FD30E|nr:hypothetical protein [Salibacter sp.]MDR9397894.1 hypothetical protein [Salibacter sp.]MDR9486584.1 hypothetical protein [Salibacter sp.]